jgi:hypothetical protein
LRRRLAKLRVFSGSEVCRIPEQNGFAAVRRGAPLSMVRQSELPRSLFETGK